MLSSMLSWSEPRVDAQSGDDGGVVVLQATRRGIERLLEAGLDDLEIEGRVQGRGDREVVVHLDRVLLVEAKSELLAEEGDEMVAELRARPAEPERVARARGDQACGAETRGGGVRDG